MKTLTTFLISNASKIFPGQFFLMLLFQVKIRLQGADPNFFGPWDLFLWAEAAAFIFFLINVLRFPKKLPGKSAAPMSPSLIFSWVFLLSLEVVFALHVSYASSVFLIHSDKLERTSKKVLLNPFDWRSAAIVSGCVGILLRPKNKNVSIDFDFDIKFDIKPDFIIEKAKENGIWTNQMECLRLILKIENLINQISIPSDIKPVWKEASSTMPIRNLKISYRIHKEEVLSGQYP